MSFFKRLVKRSKAADKCGDINFFDTPTLTGRGASGGRNGRSEKSEPLAALYPNYRNVFFSRLEQDFTPFMELPKTFRIALPNGQLISRAFPSNTSVYEVVSRLACEYDFDPTRISVCHKGNELPPSAVLLADISHDSTLRLCFRKQRRHPAVGVAGGTHNHGSSGNMTLPNPASVKEMNNNYIHSKSMGGGKRSKSSSRSAAPTQPPPVPMPPGGATGDSSAAGPPQQIKVEVIIPELSNKMVIRISPVLTCKDLLNIVCHAKKLDRSTREIRLADSSAAEVAGGLMSSAASSHSVDSSRLVVTVGQSFVVCPIIQRSSSPSGRPNYNSNHQEQPVPSAHSPSSSLMVSAPPPAPAAVQVTISTPNTPLTGTKEKKKKLSFFNLMKNKKSSSKTDVNSSAMRSLPHRGGGGGDLNEKEVMRRLRQSPSLDGVLDEQLERPLSVPHFGSSLDVSTGGGSTGGDKSSEARQGQTSERPTLPCGNLRDSANFSATSHSSSHLHSFKQVTKFRSAETVYVGPQKQEPSAFPSKENLSGGKNLSGNSSSTISGTHSTTTTPSYSIRDVTNSFSMKSEASSSSPTTSVPESPLMPYAHQVASIDNRSQELRPRIASYSSTPDIVNQTEREESSFHLSDINCPGSIQENSTFSGGPPRRKAPPPPPKKLATLSTDNAMSSSQVDMQRTEGSYETIPDVSKEPPAIPKRVALDVQGRPEEDGMRPKPKPLPRVSSLQGSKGEVPPSVARMRQKHGRWRSDGSRRQTVTVEYNPNTVGGSVDCLERITSCVSDEALASLEIPPPPLEDEMEEPLKFITRNHKGSRPLSTCESVCSCSSAYGYVPGANIDDMCQECCSCRSSTVTLLPENEDAAESEADNISLRSETSFAVEMDNLVSMAELALSENSLEQLAALKQKPAGHTVNPISENAMTPSDNTPRPLSAASLSDETASGLLTPKASSPRYLSCTDIHEAGLGLADTNIEDADSESLKVLFKSLLNQLDEVKHRLLLLGEGPWLYAQTISRETQTEADSMFSSKAQVTTLDPRNSQLPPKDFMNSSKKETPSNKEGGGVFTRKPKDTKQSPHSIRRYRRSRDLSNVINNENSSTKKGSSVVNDANATNTGDTEHQRSTYETSDFYRAAYLNHVENPRQLQHDEDSRSEEFHDSYEAFNNRNSSDSSNFDVKEDDDDDEIEEAAAESYDLSENLSLYVPEPSDHTCYISFGDNSPTSSPRTISAIHSPRSEVKLSSPRVGATGAAPLVSRLKSSFSNSSDCINNQTRIQSLKKTSAPEPPSQMAKRSASSVVVSKPTQQTNNELRNRTPSFESTASGTPTNASSDCASYEITPTTPEGFVPGAVKARRAMFETRSKQENGFDAFKLRKTTSASKQSSSGREGGAGIFWGKSNLAKSASTSDLVIITQESGDNYNQMQTATPHTYKRPLKNNDESSGSLPPKKPERLSLLKGSNCSLRQRRDEADFETETEQEWREPSIDKHVSKIRTIFGSDVASKNNKSRAAHDKEDNGGCKSPEPRMNHLL